jgi:hypothetical protein
MASSSKKLQRSGGVRIAKSANSCPIAAEICYVSWARCVLFHFLTEEAGMAELAERVARLEERFDGVAAAIADLKVAIKDLDSRMQVGFSEMRSESAGIRGEMNTQFRWIVGSIGSAALAILVAVLAAILATG